MVPLTFNVLNQELLPTFMIIITAFGKYKTRQRKHIIIIIDFITF